jgi:hemoglobin
MRRLLRLAASALAVLVAATSAACIREPCCRPGAAPTPPKPRPRFVAVVPGTRVALPPTTWVQDPRAFPGATPSDWRFGPVEVERVRRDRRAAAPDLPPSPAPPPAPLLDRLGGRAGVEIVVDAFLERLAADPRVIGNQMVARRMAAAHLPSLRRHLVDWLCRAAGGADAYTGRDMASAHAGLAITTSEWDATIDDLLLALDHAKVGPGEKADVLAAVAPVRAQVVGK